MCCPKTEIAGWRLTRHAKERMHQHGFTTFEVSAALQSPQVSYPQSDRGPRRQVRQQGRVAVIVDTAERVIITVVFRSHDDWQRQQRFGGAA